MPQQKLNSVFHSFRKRSLHQDFKAQVTATIKLKPIVEQELNYKNVYREGGKKKNIPQKELGGGGRCDRR